MEKAKFYKVCPQCGSKRMKLDGRSSIMESCGNCGFRAPSFPEMTEEAAVAFKKEADKRNSVPKTRAS